MAPTYKHDGVYLHAGFLFYPSHVTKKQDASLEHTVSAPSLYRTSDINLEAWVKVESAKYFGRDTLRLC